MKRLLLIERYLTLQNIRRLYSLFFFCLFVVLILLTDYRYLKGYNVRLFLEIDPLVAFSTLLSSGTIYRGMVIAGVVVALTAFVGRFFCSWICPFGILNQWISNLLVPSSKKRIRLNQYRTLYTLKYYILVGMLVFSVAGSLVTGLLDPIALLLRSIVTTVMPAIDLKGGFLYSRPYVYHGAALITVVFLGLVFLNRYIPRFWCRVLCPLGALLALVSRFSLLRITRDVELCTDCNKCLENCHGGCNPHRDIVYMECHLCMNCIQDCPEGAIRYGLPEAGSSVQSEVSLSRRHFIETVVFSAVAFTMIRTSISSATLPEARVIRPPGSLAEVDFLRRCVRCGKCMKVCPTNAIQPALLEGGIEALWTPVLSFRTGYCEYNCVLCGHVCPTGAIVPLSVDEKVGTPVKIGTAFFDRGRCLPWAMNRECIVCEEVCPTSPKAIWLETVRVRTRQGEVKVLRRPHLDPGLCIGCGICEYRCPVQGLAAVRVSSVGESRSKQNQMILS